MTREMLGCKDDEELDAEMQNKVRHAIGSLIYVKDDYIAAHRSLSIMLLDTWQGLPLSHWGW